MGKQVSFYLHPDDEPEFDQFLKASGDLVLAPEIQPTGTLVTVPDTLTTTRDRDAEGTRIYVVRRSDEGTIKLRRSGNDVSWMIDDGPLLAVHFDRCRLNTTSLVQGRLYFEPSFVRDGGWVRKPDDFVKWADKLLLGVRRRMSKFEQDVSGIPYRAYIGPAALAWKERHNATLRSGYLALIAAEPE